MKKLKIISILVMLVFISGLSACEEDVDNGEIELSLTESQLAAVVMRGTWGQASNITLPPGTTENALDKLLMKFTITDDYEPDKFEAASEAATDFLFKPGTGTWKWASGTTDIELVGVSPVTMIKVEEDGQSFRLTFTYNGEDGGRVSGVGEYGVTLTKIAP